MYIHCPTSVTQPLSGSTGTRILDQDTLAQHMRGRRAVCAPLQVVRSRRTRCQCTLYHCLHTRLGMSGNWKTLASFSLTPSPLTASHFDTHFDTVSPLLGLPDKIVPQHVYDSSYQNQSSRSLPDLLPQTHFPPSPFTHSPDTHQSSQFSPVSEESLRPCYSLLRQWERATS